MPRWGQARSGAQTLVHDGDSGRARSMVVKSRPSAAEFYGLEIVSPLVLRSMGTLALRSVARPSMRTARREKPD